MNFKKMFLIAIALCPVITPCAIAGEASNLDIPIVATLYAGKLIVKDDRTAYYTGQDGLYFVRWSDGYRTKVEHIGDRVYIGDDGNRAVMQVGKNFICFLGDRQIKLCISGR